MSGIAPTPSGPTTADAPEEVLPPSFLTEDDLPKSFLTTADLDPHGSLTATSDASGLASRVASDIGGGIREAPKQALRGVEQGLNGLSSSAFDAASWLNEHIIDLGQVTYDFHGSANPTNWSLGYSKGMPSTNDARIPDSAIPGPASTVTGGLVEGATQFATGMALAGKFLRPFGFGAVVTNTAASGASMALAFDPHEQRLSDLVQSYPALQNPVTEFLASHPDDGAAMARVRAGLEGLGLGAVAEGVVAGLKGLRSHYAGDSAAAIEHVDPTPVAPAPSAPAAPTVIDRSTFDAAAHQDLGKFAANTSKQVQEALDGGATVVLHTAGKEVPITAVDRGMIADATGQRWGAMAYASSTKDRLEIRPKSKGTGTAADPIELGPVEVMSEAQGKPAEGPKGGAATASADSPPRGLDESLNENRATLPLEGGGPGADSPRGALEENPGAAVNGYPGQARKLVELTLDDLSTIRELQGNVTRASTVADADGVFRPLSGIRTDLIEHDGDLGNILDTLRIHYREAMDRATGGTPQDGGTMQPVRTFADVRRNTERLADLIGDNPQLLMQRMGSMHGNLMHLDAETRLYGDFLATVGDRLGTLAKAVDNPVGDMAGFANRGELLVAFAKQYELMGNVQAMYKGIQTNVARTLGAFRIGSKINPNLIASLANPDDLFAGGIANMERLARRINATGGDLAAVAKSTRPGFIARFLSGMNEYWINSVLSGPKTHMANMIGNTFSAAIMPAERMVSGALRVGTPAGRDEFLEGGLHYVGMAMSLRDAVVMSARALKMGDGILDAAHNPIAEMGGPAISAGAVNAPSGSMSGFIANGLGALVRLPSRLLTSEDEFFKQLVYRGAVRARAMREGFKAGLWRDPKNPNAFSDYVARALDNAATATGTGNDPMALQMARYATFQNSLAAQTNTGMRTIGETISEVSASHPGLKLILPFVRTPTNMLRYVWDRTPGLNLARGQFRNDLTGVNGPAAQSQALARHLTGAALWATAITYAADGTITGGGPADKEGQKALRATGWQPYSVRVQNPDGSTRYESFDRLNPFASFFTIAADFAEVR